MASLCRGASTGPVCRATEKFFQNFEVYWVFLFGLGENTFAQGPVAPVEHKRGERPETINKLCEVARKLRVGTTARIRASCWYW
jgi:hypothetical protein